MKKNIEKTIKHINLDCGKVVTDQKKNIFLEVRKFDSIHLLKTSLLDNLVLDQYIQGKDFDNLSKSDSESLEGQLTLTKLVRL